MDSLSGQERYFSARQSSFDYSPVSPVLHIKLGTSPTGAAQPVIQPVLPHTGSKRRAYDYDAQELAGNINSFCGLSSSHEKAQKVYFTSMLDQRSRLTLMTVRLWRPWYRQDE